MSSRGEMRVVVVMLKKKKKRIERRKREANYNYLSNAKKRI